MQDAFYQTIQFEGNVLSGAMKDSLMIFCRQGLHRKKEDTELGEKMATRLKKEKNEDAY